MYVQGTKFLSELFLLTLSLPPQSPGLNSVFRRRDIGCFPDSEIPTTWFSTTPRLVYLYFYHYKCEQLHISQRQKKINTHTWDQLCCLLITHSWHIFIRTSLPSNEDFIKLPLMLLGTFYLLDVLALRNYRMSPFLISVNSTVFIVQRMDTNTHITYSDEKATISKLSLSKYIMFSFPDASSFEAKKPNKEKGLNVWWMFFFVFFPHGYLKCIFLLYVK